MIRNELQTSGRQLLLFLALAALLAALIPLAGGQAREVDFGEIFLPYFQVMSLLAALLFGLSAFAEENRQRGFDYLLSLPLSRNSILAIKTLSRLAGLLPLYLIALAAVKLIGAGASLVTPFAFNLLFVSLFFIGLTFSASSPHLAVNFGLSLGFFLLFYSGLALISRAAFLNSANSRLQELTPGSLKFMREVLFYQPEGKEINSLIWLPPILLLIACMGALAWRFKSFDPSRRGRFNQRLLGSLVFLLAVSILPAYLLAGLAVESTLERSQVELSSDHRLFVKQGARLRLFEPGQKKPTAEFRLGGYGFMPIYDDQNRLYFVNYLLEKNSYLERIGVLDKQERRLDWALQAEPGEHLLTFPDRSRPLLYVLRLKKSYFQGADLELLEIEPGSGRSRSIFFPDPVRLPSVSYHFAVLAGGGEPRLILGLRNEKPVSFNYHLISSRGGGEQLLTEVNGLEVIGDLLLFNQGQEFKIARLGPEGLETLFSSPDGAFHFKRGPLDGPWVFASRANQLFRLDLRDFNLEEYRGPGLHQAHSGTLRAVYQDEQGFLLVEYLTPSQDRVTSNFYRVDESGRRLLMNLDLAIDPKRDWIQYWGHGLLVYREGRLQAYAYPDMSELDFPAWR